jgi:hypothetical protein
MFHTAAGFIHDNRCESGRSAASASRVTISNLHLRSSSATKVNLEVQKSWKKHFSLLNELDVTELFMVPISQRSEKLRSLDLVWNLTTQNLGSKAVSSHVQSITFNDMSMTKRTALKVVIDRNIVIKSSPVKCQWRVLSNSLYSYTLFLSLYYLLYCLLLLPALRGTLFGTIHWLSFISIFFSLLMRVPKCVMISVGWSTGRRTYWNSYLNLWHFTLQERVAKMDVIQVQKMYT